MSKVLGFLTDWRNGVAVLLAAGIIIWLMEDGGLPTGSIIIIFLVCFAAVHALTGIWALLTKRKKAP